MTGVENREQEEHRAAPPRAPQPTQTFMRAREEQQRYVRERETAEHRSLLRALILLAAAALLFSIARAGLERVFVQGWWRQW